MIVEIVTSPAPSVQIVPDANSIEVTQSVAALVELGLSSGPQGATGSNGSATFQETAGAALSALRIVRIASDGKAYVADPASLATASPIVGMTVSSASINTPVNIISSGFHDDAAFMFSAGAVLYCGASGVITNVAPAGVLCVIGYSIMVGRIYLSIEPPIV